MTAVKVAAMADKGRPADYAAAETAAMETMEAAAAMKAAATAMKSTAVTAATAVATATAMTAASAADLDQSVGNEFRGRRRRARTCRR